MKIFIIANQQEDINFLKKIISDNFLGSIVGESNNCLEGLNETLLAKADLLILDIIDENKSILDMISGKEIKNKFIVISKFYCEDLMVSSYEAGAEYYIPKPIDEIQLKNMIKKIEYQLSLENKIKKVQKIFREIDLLSREKKESYDYKQEINSILLRLGIVGEKGTEDILEILEYIIEEKVNIHEITIRELCSKFTDNPKSMEQKVRRTINISFRNIASLGIEDYMNETFVKYSNTLFNFEQVKKEMDYIRKKSDEKGSINMKKFLSGIAIYCEKLND